MQNEKKHHPNIKLNRQKSQVEMKRLKKSVHDLTHYLTWTTTHKLEENY